MVKRKGTKGLTTICTTQKTNDQVTRTQVKTRGFPEGQVVVVYYGDLIDRFIRQIYIYWDFASLHDVDDCDVDGMDDPIAHRDSSITKQQQLYPCWPSLNV